MSCEEYQVAGLLGPLECYPTKGDCVIIDCALCRIKELEAEVTHLKNSLGLCHYYAGCDEFVCELDGDTCTGQRVRPIESLIPPPPEAKQ